MGTRTIAHGDYKLTQQSCNSRILVARIRALASRRRIKRQLFVSAYENNQQKSETKYACMCGQDDVQKECADDDVDGIQVITLPVAESLQEAKNLLLEALNSKSNQIFSNLTSGLIRYEVHLPNSETTPLSWLKTQREKIKDQICMYFGSRLSPAPGTPGMEIAQQNTSQLHSVAGIGAACVENPHLSWQKQYNNIKPFLKNKYPQIRAFVALRFLGGGKIQIQPEWSDFGQGIVLIPSIEFKRENQHLVVSVSVAWRKNGNFTSFLEAARNAMNILQQIDTERAHQIKGCGVLESEDQIFEYNPDLNQWNSNISNILDRLQEDDSINSSKFSASIENQMAFQQYLEEGQEGLDNLLSASQIPEPPSIQKQIRNQNTLTKVVLARQTKFQCKGKIDPLGVLQVQKSKNPRAYQLAIILPTGTAFVSSTPERLYVRSGRDIATEAVASTRPRGPRGDLKKDFEYSMDLLQNPKDHAEFCAVRDWVRESLEGISEKNSVLIEREKSLIKQATVQHLYGCLCGKIKKDINDRDILEVLHPTPAVCGRPQKLALQQIVEFENFDRGLYAGPVGWISGSAAEFAVAIRSALFAPAHEKQQLQQIENLYSQNDCTQVIMYSGVGVVKGSRAKSEWQELNLKILQYQKILLPPLSVFQQPNLNLVWTHLLFEEFARQGVDTVCIAPGSRSSALVLAAGKNPQLRVVVCIDERSLGFWALGYGKATRRPAVVVTSSGTAVANLFPAVVEASQSNVPMIICSADRPLELRDTGANQTINQVGIFGCYVRYECDLDAPSKDVGARFVLSTADTVYRHAVGGHAGPVHLNCQFREPLSPRRIEWNRNGDFMRGISKWQYSLLPYTQPAQPSPAYADLFSDNIRRKLLEAKKGLLIVGELRDAEDVNRVIKLAKGLQWAIVADVLSGMRVGIESSMMAESPVVYHMDQILTDKDNWGNFQPDTICFIGDHLLSKRLQQFMEWCVLDSPSTTEIIQLQKHEKRNDPSHIISHRLIGNIPEFRRTQQISDSQKHFNRILQITNSHIARCIKSKIESTEMCEPQVAHLLAQIVPQHHALFLGNSMPIRDMDMFSQPRRETFLQTSQDYRENTQFCNHSSSLLLDAQNNNDEILLSKIDDSNRRQYDTFQTSEKNQVEINKFTNGNNNMMSQLNNQDVNKINQVSQRMQSNGYNTQIVQSSNTTKNRYQIGNYQGLYYSNDKDSIGVPIGSNRGASGIDGVISTAVGFSAGQDRPTTLVIGDVSFLHDTNGLTFLTSSSSDSTVRCPVTVVVINNNGGGIFEFLPLAKTISKEELDHLWTTPQSVDIGTLCQAHGVLHVCVKDVQQLRQALEAGWQSNQHNVIEVVTNRSQNHEFHMQLNEISKQATQRAVKFCLNSHPGILDELQYDHFELPLKKQLTTESKSNLREGLIVRVGLRSENGVRIMGEGEVAPLPGLHHESLVECEGQFAGLAELIQNTEIPEGEVQLLDGSLTDFWRQCVGICPENLYPSVRFGVEMAILDAMKNSANQAQEIYEDVELNGLIGNCSKEEAVQQAKDVVNNGIVCIKIKVGCRSSPLEDAEVIGAIRNAVGPQIVLRADANQRWNLQQAIEFGHAAYQHQLQYLEEPTNDPQQFQNFYLTTGVHFALDETLDQFLKNQGAKQNQQIYTLLQNSICDMGMNVGLQAVIVKPMLIGSVDAVLEIGKWAKSIDCQTIISSCFETTIGINFLKYLASEIDKIYEKKLFHGLGTLNWYKSDKLQEFQHAQRAFQNSQSFVDKIYSFDLQRFLNDGNFGTMNDIDSTVYVNDDTFSKISIKTIQLIGESDKPGLIFLHGMFGSAEDWMPIMRNVHQVSKYSCIAIDLNFGDQFCSIESMAEAIRIFLIDFEKQNVCQGFGVVGYSMGGRIAFNLLRNQPNLFNFAILISSSPGIKDKNSRQKRAKIDQMRAQKILRYNSLEYFLDSCWYVHEMWGDLRKNPRYAKLIEQRGSGNVNLLARMLEWSSPGRSESLWDDLEKIQVPVLFVAGKRDEKYCQIGQELKENLSSCQICEVEGCGHAVHFEQPILLSLKILNFLK